MDIIEVRARMLINGSFAGNEIAIRLPDLDDPRIRELRNEILRYQNNYYTLEYKYQMLLLRFRPWWKKLLRLR